MENFSNSILLPADLPEIKKETFTALDKKYRSIIVIQLLFFALFLAGLFLAFAVISKNNISLSILILVGSVLILILAASALISILGFSKKGYLVREQDISFQRGLITYRLTTVPFNRIQHVEVNQGILAKMFRLSSVKLYTAGGSMSDLSIPGLPVETAQRLKAFLFDKISEHE